MVFQSYALYPHLSVAATFRLGMEIRGVMRHPSGPRPRCRLELLQLVASPKRPAISRRQRHRRARSGPAARPRCSCSMNRYQPRPPSSRDSAPAAAHPSSVAVATSPPIPQRTMHRRSIAGSIRAGPAAVARPPTLHRPAHAFWRPRFIVRPHDQRAPRTRWAKPPAVRPEHLMPAAGYVTAGRAVSWNAGPPSKLPLRHSPGPLSAVCECGRSTRMPSHRLGSPQHSTPGGSGGPTPRSYACHNSFSRGFTPSIHPSPFHCQSPESPNLPGGKLRSYSPLMRASSTTAPDAANASSNLVRSTPKHSLPGVARSIRSADSDLSSRARWRYDITDSPAPTPISRSSLRWALLGDRPHPRHPRHSRTWCFAPHTFCTPVSARPLAPRQQRA